ncbi:hypothetical protein H310_13199 [Aphanomyces invadans]|uniref:C3H1-type domain-containing protein n=1 Tax=Aphanomyces invadans TaxID=157072 RepID=A0A024TFZ6_9STRA|nr:hypothetical protein H310_13199 [Aphanomyces invadans]ETV92516.1 hypothetical protein H310_13199 [Aphanomyces invadans]|eukprot:XP_008878823.1 hypothetical protein H310_13199 [Aphanomyces invadans]
MSAATVAPIPDEVGLLLTPQQRNAVQDRVNALLGWNSRELAPMSTSMPMLRSHRKQIVDLGYLVGSLWTGIRYLALLVSGRCYFIAHNYEIRETWLFAPLRQQDRPQSMANASENEPSQHVWTILDGTLVLNQDKLCYVISDMLAMNGVSVMSLKLEDRLKTIQNSVISPLLKIPMAKGHPPSQFSLLFPPNRPLNKMASSVRQLTPVPTNTAVQHAGLMFIPLSLPYAPGHSKGVYYWTYPSAASAFFQLGVDWRGMPKKPVFKLNVFDKGMNVFYDWITFPQDAYDHFCADKKVSHRIIECVFDPDMPTFIPSDDKSDNSGHTNFHHDVHGVGYRKGGWKLIRVRKDMGRPHERAHVGALEKALVHDPIRSDELEFFFTDHHHQYPSKAPPATATGPTLSSMPPPNLAPDEIEKWKKSGGGGGPTGQGVCYDFQNKGVCQRGAKCHFSHCACHNVCQCTPAAHTYGQRPDFRRNDLDAPPPETLLGPTESSSGADGTTAPTGPLDDHHGNGGVEGGIEASAASAGVAKGAVLECLGGAATIATSRASKQLATAVSSGVYAPLTSCDKEAVAAKRALLTATANRRMWSSLGVLDAADGGGAKKKLKKAPGRSAKVGWIVSALGEVSGHTNFHHDVHGVGYRKGGWKLIRVRKDMGRPHERAHVGALEKALVHDPIRSDELEFFFTDHHHQYPSKAPPATATGPTLSSLPPPNLAPDEIEKWKKSGGGGGPTGQGVCYDFQNKGVCQRGAKCHFSHCACHNVCQCTPAAHTYGQRPDFRRNDLDAPPPETLLGPTESSSGADGTTAPTGPLDDHHGNGGVEGGIEASGASAGVAKGAVLECLGGAATIATSRASKQLATAVSSGVYAPLTSCDKEAVAAKRALLTATANRRMWSSLGVLDAADGGGAKKKLKKAPGRSAKVGWIVSALGEVSYVRGATAGGDKA